MHEALKISERAAGLENKSEKMKPETEEATDKNEGTKELMAAELHEMGLSPQTIRRLLNLKNRTGERNAE